MADSHPAELWFDGARVPADHVIGEVGRGFQTAMLDASITKYYTTERAYAVADRCLQVFGGMGLLREWPIERVLRQLRVLRVVEGASEVQKLVIARTMGLGRGD